MPGLIPFYAVPTGGDVVVFCEQRDCLPEDSEFEVSSLTTDASIPGAFIRRHDGERYSWAVFRPATPLTSGQTFEVHGRDHTPSWWFEVVDSEPFEPKTLEASMELFADRMQTGEDLTCCEAPRSCDHCDADSLCFSATVNVRAHAHLYFSAPHSASMSQFLYHVTFSGDGLAPVDLEPITWQQYARHLYAAESSRYCFKVEAESIADGSRTFATEGCTNNSIRFEERELEQDERSPTYYACAEPIPGFEDEWCQSVKMECSSFLFASPDCPERLAPCEQPDAGPSADAASEEELVTSRRGDGSACSMVPGRSDRSGWFSALWLALLGVVVRRKQLRP